jgi:hypothetical protein
MSHTQISNNKRADRRRKHIHSPKPKPTQTPQEKP